MKGLLNEHKWQKKKHGVAIAMTTAIAKKKFILVLVVTFVLIFNIIVNGKCV